MNLLRNVWIWIGFGLTVTYFYGAYRYGVLHSEFLTEFEKMPLNNKGDSLAGFFAPLAFLWLFVATMIQSQELAAQRKEIEDNRKVMQEQSDAAKDQAKFLNAQTATMERQTQLLTEQIEITRQQGMRTQKIALFDQRLEIYNSLVLLGKNVHGTNISTLTRDSLFSIMNRSEFMFGEDILKWLYGLIKMFNDHIALSREYASIKMSGRAIDYEYTQDKARQERLDMEIKAIEKIAAQQLNEALLIEMFEPYLTLYEQDAERLQRRGEKA